MSNYAIVGILCVQTLYNSLSSTIGQYIYTFYLHTYPNASSNTSNSTMISTFRPFEIFGNETNKCTYDDISPTNDAELWAQQRSANLFFWINLTSSCPVIIMTYILGLYTSKLGKRFVLVLPMIGATSQLAIWLAIIYLRLPEYWWYIAAFLVGLSGSGGVLGLALNLIITENTIESDRSSRFVRLNAMQTALSAIATFGIGYYIIWRAFTDLYWLALALQILSIVIVIFCFKSSASIDLNEQTPLLASTNNPSKEISTTNCCHFFDVCTVFRLNRRSKKKSLSLFLTLFSNIFYMLAATCFAPMLWILLSAPFCWTSKDVGNYSALGAISSAILSLVGMQVLTYVGANDALICVISQLFFCTSCLWIAFARYSWQLYVGLLVSAFSGYQSSLTASMMSKWLKSDERNHAFTCVTEINTIISVLGSSFFNWIYARTVVHSRTLTLFIAAGISLIPVLLNICLFIITRQMFDEEPSTLSPTEIEPVPVRLQNTIVPHIGVADYLIMPSRSLTSSLRTPTNGRSRINSISDNDNEILINSSLNDQLIL